MSASDSTFRPLALPSALHPAARVPATTALIVLATIPYLTVGTYDWQRMWQFGWFLLLAVGLGTRRLRPDAHLFSRPLLVFFLLGAVSCAFAYAMRNAVAEVAIFWLLLATAAMVAGELRRSPDSILAVLRVLAVGCGLYALETLAIYAAAVTLGQAPAADAFAPNFSNYRFLNHTQTITLPLLVLLAACATPRTWAARATFALAAYWWTLLLLSTSRGTFMGIVAGCACVLVLCRAHARRYLVTMLATFLAGVIVYYVFFQWLPHLMGMSTFGMLFDVARRTSVDPTSARLELWQRAAEMAAAHPLLGAGPMQYAHWAVDLHNAAHPHNWILQLASEWGIPAALCAMLAVGLGLRAMWRARRATAPGSTPAHVWTGLAVAVIAVLVDGLVSGLMVLPSSQLLIALLAGCAAGVMQPQDAAPLQPARALALRVSAVVACVLLVWAAWPGISAYVGLRAIPPHATDLLMPRLWGDGVF